MLSNPWSYFVSVCSDCDEVRRRYPLGKEGEDPAPWAPHVGTRVKVGKRTVAIVALRDDDKRHDLCDLYPSRLAASKAHPDLTSAIAACTDLGGSGIDWLPTTLIEG